MSEHPVNSIPRTPTGYPMMQFAHEQAWASRLHKNHTTSRGVWLRIAKKETKHSSVSYAEALEVASCYGWIDGQKKSYDEASWLQKFTPRGAMSIWSKVNRKKAGALIRSGRMKPAGLKAVEDARRNGRWAAAYDSQSRAAVPSDLQAELNRNAKARAFFATLKGVNPYAILFRIQTAKKAETRSKRIQRFIATLEKHEKLHPREDQIAVVLNDLKRRGDARIRVGSAVCT